MKDTKNIFPKDFEYWSGVRINQYATLRAKLDRKKNRELAAKIKQIAAKYSSLMLNGENYVVIIADSKKSLVREGALLHHCVGRMDYDQRIAKEQSLIFFIRKVEATNKPFVTLEFNLEDLAVRQCYAAYDKKPDKEVLDFVDVWAKKAKKKAQKIQRMVA